MELARLIETLTDPAAYPARVAAVEVRQTHISAVFLVGEHVYKVKKPVALGFLDFSTLDQRRHFCDEEVRLNRRLAPDVYLGVVPIVERAGRAVVEGQGTAIEWAVKMRRLPDDAMLEHRLQQGEDVVPIVAALARRIAQFHAAAERGEHIAEFGRFDVVSGNALENFAQAQSQVGTAISREVLDRLQTLSRETLNRLRPLIEARAASGVPCDTHGDLRLGHVYAFPDRASPADLVIVDCIEFNERFRFADPVSDMAFLAMSLERAGRADLAALFAEDYFRAASDDAGRDLLPFYVSYRAAVRGKVDGMQAVQAEIRPADRQVALSKARGYWLLALAALEEPQQRPCLVLVGGLPGTGKSTLAAALAERAGCEVIRSDVVRKELAGEPAALRSSSEFEAGIYTSAWTGRTYDECLRRAEELLWTGRRAIIDASFRDDGRRRAFLDAAVRLGVPAIVLLCQVDPAKVRDRLARRAGDASDADWSIYQQTAEHWQAPGETVRRALVTIDTNSQQDALEQALAALAQRGLVERGLARK